MIIDYLYIKSTTCIIIFNKRLFFIILQYLLKYYLHLCSLYHVNNVPILFTNNKIVFCWIILYRLKYGYWLDTTQSTNIHYSHNTVINITRGLCCKKKTHTSKNLLYTNAV